MKFVFIMKHLSVLIHVQISFLLVNFDMLMQVFIVYMAAYLLQVKFEKAWQLPFHLLGGGPNPSSLKLSDSGQIPVSNIPKITSLSIFVLSTSSRNPMKSHDLVVWSCFLVLGNTDTTVSMPNHLGNKVIEAFAIHIFNTYLGMDTVVSIFPNTKKQLHTTRS
ncbi:uncharacterized protein LOC111384741 [Olea europaea var. sylvestris]|uniref:uncharacterized protein LOC111384741 n=1 Tax=Olea europaea var. sylvestris TaxID=158386 RepID=UPI000C1CE6BD|nr:uncharacterized protein LOC111384741 [Olea europaea var. sylvestris]